MLAESALTLADLCINSVREFTSLIHPQLLCLNGTLTMMITEARE